MHNRTPQLLAARLEKLSAVALRSGAAAPAIANLLESVAVATLHAVALDLLCGPPVQEVRAPAAEHPVLMRLLDAA